MEPLDPPADSKPGDRVFVDGYQHETAGGMCSIYWILHDVSINVSSSLSIIYYVEHLQMLHVY